MSDIDLECHPRGGRHTCVERDVEVLPMERVVTTLPEDSFGMARLLPDYRVETTMEREGEGRTRRDFRHYDSIQSWKARLFHWIAGPRKLLRCRAIHLSPSARKRFRPGLSEQGNPEYKRDIIQGPIGIDAGQVTVRG